MKKKIFLFLHLSPLLLVLGRSGGTILCLRPLSLLLPRSYIEKERPRCKMHTELRALGLDVIQEVFFFFS